jgi:hypothetical protein
MILSGVANVGQSNVTEAALFKKAPIKILEL